MDKAGERQWAATLPVQLIAKRDGRRRPLCAEKLPRKLFHHRRVIALAAENVEIGVICVVGKVAANQGGRDQLNHRIACHPPRTEIDDLAFPESLHVNELTELNDITADMVGVADKIRMAVLKVNSGAQSPGLPFTYHILGRNG